MMGWLNSVVSWTFYDGFVFGYELFCRLGMIESNVYRKICLVHRSNSTNTPIPTFRSLCWTSLRTERQSPNRETLMLIYANDGDMILKIEIMSDPGGCIHSNRRD